MYCLLIDYGTDDTDFTGIGSSSECVCERDRDEKVSVRGRKHKTASVLAGFVRL